MHTTVIIPFHHQDDLTTLQWTLEGFGRQMLKSGHSLEVLVGVDGGLGTFIKPLALPSEQFKVIQFPRIGSAAVRNALVKQARAHTDLLLFTNADTRPDPDMVQCHADTMAKLPDGSLIVGAVPWERTGQPTVFDALLEETTAVFSYPNMLPESWHDFRAAYALNLSVRYAQFMASGGFPEAIRPMYYEDTVFAHRLLGAKPALFYQPAARAVHRHPMTLDQYLDREELLGMMAPVLAHVAPDSFNALFSANVPVQVLAQRYQQWVLMDGPVHAAAYDSLSAWSRQPQSRLGDPESRALTLRALFDLHIPLKRLAFRVGFLKGLQLMQDAQWQMRRSQRLWNQALGSLQPTHAR